MTIGEILLNYDSDKNKGVTPEKNGHYYGDSYQEIFSKFDKNSNINIMEVGVQKGGSVSAWKDYFTNAFVLGIDIDDSRLEEYKRDDVEFILSDIKDLSLKENPLINDKLFDIIIDDGSHYTEDVVFFFENYLDKLNINGYFIIEDTQSPGYCDNLISNKIDFLKQTKLKNEEFEMSIHDLRSKNNYYDDYLIIVKRIL